MCATHCVGKKYPTKKLIASIDSINIDISQNQVELIDTKSMTFSEHGDYLRILRLVYSEQVKDNESSINEQLVSINQSISNLLDPQDENAEKKRNALLIKQDSDTSGQGSNDLSKSTNLDSNLDREIGPAERTTEIDVLRDAKQEDAERRNHNATDTVDCDSLVMKLRTYSAEDRRPIYLTSKLFLSQRKKGQTINDLKQEIQEWYKNYQQENCSKNDDLGKPKVLACETMQIFCKQDDLLNVQKASEETFMYNR